METMVEFTLTDRAIKAIKKLAG